MESSLCKCTFQLTSNTGEDETVWMIGSCDALGWEVGKVMSKPDSKNPLWSLELELPLGAEFEYRYKKMWHEKETKRETFEKNRSVKIDKETMLVDDGVFGHFTKEELEQKPVEEARVDSKWEQAAAAPTVDVDDVSLLSNADKRKLFMIKMDESNKTRSSAPMNGMEKASLDTLKQNVTDLELLEQKRNTLPEEAISTKSSTEKEQERIIRVENKKEEEAFKRKEEESIKRRQLAAKRREEETRKREAMDLERKRMLEAKKAQQMKEITQRLMSDNVPDVDMNLKENMLRLEADRLFKEKEEQEMRERELQIREQELKKLEQAKLEAVSVPAIVTPSVDTQLVNQEKVHLENQIETVSVPAESISTTTETEKVPEIVESSSTKRPESNKKRGMRERLSIRRRHSSKKMLELKRTATPENSRKMKRSTPKTKRLFSGIKTWVKKQQGDFNDKKSRRSLEKNIDPVNPEPISQNPEPISQTIVQEESILPQSTTTTTVVPDEGVVVQQSVTTVVSEKTPIVADRPVLINEPVAATVV